MTTEYATTKQLNDFMDMTANIPNYEIVGDDRSYEEVGTGDSSNTIFDTDHAFIIADSYNFYYGSSEAVALTQPLTETTHYTINVDTGRLTLTPTGVALVGTNKIFCSYSYNNLSFTDTELSEVLDRMESYIDKKTGNHWTDGTDSTPNYIQILDEKDNGRGLYNRDYFTKQRPLPDVSTTLNGAVAVDDVEITVVSTSGFPASGYLSIDDEKITYSAKTDTTFTVTALTSAHDDASEVLPFVFEASNTPQGSDPVWTVLKKNEDYDLDLSTGRVHFMASALNVTDAQAYELNPPFRVPNRFRNSYIWGNDDIPGEITQLTLMLSAKDLIHRAVRKAHSAGMNNFEPNMIDVDRFWIEDTIKSHKNIRAGRTI